MSEKTFKIEESGTAKAVRFLGRTYTYDYAAKSLNEKYEKTVFFDWTMSGFEFSFIGTAASAEIVSNRFKDKKIWLYAYVDGDTGPGKGRMFAVGGKEKDSYVLCSGLPEGKHTVEVRRASACCMGGLEEENGPAGMSGLVSLTITGRDPELCKRPADRKLKLEFIGDSITCGDNINRVDGNNIEDGTLTYAAFTAHKLGADINVMSISGNGCICCLFGTPLLDLPDQYMYTDSLAKGTPGEDRWDFSKYRPDVVVVNLGTNDRGGVPRVFGYDEFKNGCDKAVGGGKTEHHTGVKDFLTMIRENNPQAKILWVCGAMGRELCGVINDAVREWNESIGETVAYFSPLPENWSFDNGKGYDDCHPSVLASKVYAEILAVKIKQILGEI